MKKINSILASLLFTASLFLTQQATAQAPQKMSYQSVIRNSSNVLLAGTQVGIRISVLQGSATGTAVYVETQTATTNGNGLVSLQIGTGTATTGTFAGINWAAGPYFIKTETDPAGGTNYTITGTQEMLSVPYAMYAAKSGNTVSPCGYAIGQNVTALGGIIFYLDASGCHGLVCAPTDQSTGISWNNGLNTNTTAFADCVGGGAGNTSMIIYNQGATATNYAAGLARAYTGGGFSNWYLPSKYELDLMHKNIGQGNVLGLGNVGGFANYYWSSTESGINGAWEHYFIDGFWDAGSKNSPSFVRAVRAF